MKAKRPHVARALVLEGHVRDITDAGDAVVETERGIVMARGGLPAERVRVQLEPARRGVLRGVTVAILEASAARVEPACALAERCGGCPLMALQLAAQRELKLARVRRALCGLGRPELWVQLEAAGAELGYRRRARFAWKRVGQGHVLGYHAHGSKHLVDVHACPVLEPVLDRALQMLRARLLPVLAGSGEIELSTNAGSHARVVADVRCETAVSEASYRAAEELAATEPFAGVALRIADGAPARFGTLAVGEVGLDGVALSTPAGAFSQINSAVNARLGELVLGLAEARNARVLELYAGQGNFTVALASQAAELLAIESHPASAQACRENLRARQLSHVRVLERDVAAARVRDAYDVIVLDPPRAGAPELCALAASTRAERVVYVSCHMTTLGRDLRALHDSGFAVERAHVLDMFPQTGHVEAVVRMRRIAS